MKNAELQELLKKFSPDMEVKLHIGNEKLKDFEGENIIDHAPDDQISEKGYLIRGKEPRVIVLNPPVY